LAITPNTISFTPVNPPNNRSVDGLPIGLPPTFVEDRYQSGIKTRPCRFLTRTHYTYDSCCHQIRETGHRSIGERRRTGEECGADCQGRNKKSSGTETEGKLKR
jgi:hypothetical protein